LGYQLVLQIEVRVPKSALGGMPIEDAVGVSFIGGEDMRFSPKNKVRQEDKFAVLPWETIIMQVEAWEVAVNFPGSDALFRLDLPRRPPRSTEWSDWVAPRREKGYATTEGLTLRYRFRLVRYGTDSPD
jgi:hypothetical protein